MLPIPNNTTGDQLLKSLKIAIDAEKHHRNRYNALRDDFTQATIDRWDAQILAWDEDHGNENPYAEPSMHGKVFFCCVFVILD